MMFNDTPTTRSFHAMEANLGMILAKVSKGSSVTSWDASKISFDISIPTNRS